ncbi:MAG: TlpA family protein disulfide reductase [Stellaceae bacterium]
MRVGSTVSVVVILFCVAVGIAFYVAYRQFTPLPEPAAQRETPSIGKFIAISPKLPAPEAAFNGRDGKPLHLADWRGHWVLLNLWATWCGPCVREMPSLDRMQKALGSAIAVVAISEDRGGLKVVEPFVTRLGVTSLIIGLDTPDGVLSHVKIRGLPTSFLIDPHGDIVAKLEGGSEWDKGPTLARLKEMIGR